MRHHNALYDAQACAALFDLLLDKYGVDETDVQQYPKVKKPVKKPRTKGTAASQKQKTPAAFEW